MSLLKQYDYKEDHYDAGVKALALLDTLITGIQQDDLECSASVNSGEKEVHDFGHAEDCYQRGYEFGGNDLKADIRHLMAKGGLLEEPDGHDTEG